MLEQLSSKILNFLESAKTNQEKADRTAILGIFSFLFFVVAIEQVAKFDLIEKIKSKALGIHGYALVIFSIILPVLWVVSFILERDFVDKCYRDKIPSPPKNNAITSIFIGFSLALLVVLSVDIAFFSAVYLIYIFIDFFGQSALSNTIKVALGGLPQNYASKNRKTLDSVRRYYVGRRWRWLFFLRVALQIGVLYVTFFDRRFPPEYAQCAAMLINEVVIWSWRLRLYREHDFYDPFD